MASNPLSHIHIVVPIDSKIEKEAMGEHVFLSYLFDAFSEESTSAVLQHVFLAQSGSFTITINVTTADDGVTKWLDKACLILSHPRYFKFLGKPVIWLLYTTQATLFKDAFIKRLRMALHMQAFPDVLIADLGVLSPQANSDFSYELYKPDLRPANFSSWYLEKLVQSPSSLHLFLPAKNMAHLKSLLELRYTAEEDLIQQQPHLYKLLQLLQTKSERIYEHEALLEMLAEDLSSKKAYLDFLMGKFKDGNSGQITYNEVMKIRKFYHAEYEVLPLWYKRFGHLLKVVSGKRTLKSLFDKNTKKTDL